MKLYYSPGACSLSTHIALLEAGMTAELVQVDVRGHKLVKDGSDFYAITPLGYVPILELDDGTRLSEGVAIVQYIADQVPEKNLAPANGTLARYQLQSWLNFITTELHKGFGPLFKPTTPEVYKPVATEALLNRLAFMDAHLAKQQYVASNEFSVADAYLFTVLGWAPHVGIDLSPFAHLQAFQGRVAARPAVQAALKAEGLLK
ncbi:glutathione transferase GstA [Aeromonas cavernicola]|uniref:Glutathione transferase GstA n=1 Tax=Aeromonas cavernicola TaxID=1006623 RepID=A0A2H9U596_9GAMM|nr:glutathione transferase GstA [Aeromonas cavernicola]PJG59164.1 glutathione transferase GstA [Aeromonas cavernicola]